MNKRPQISKDVRNYLYEKYNGRCALCGAVLEIGWHVTTKNGNWLLPVHIEGKGPFINIRNLLPACIPCGSAKGDLSVEQFRKKMEMALWFIEQNIQFKQALRFGLIQLTNTSVVFYFEKSK